MRVGRTHRSHLAASSYVASSSGLGFAIGDGDSWTVSAIPLRFATDPLNLQPRIRPFFRNAAEHLRKYPPTEVRQNELDLLVESIEAPWGIRYERAIKEVFNPEADDPYVASAALVEKVRELGLQPFVQPEPLPPIQPDDVVLICWMGVDESCD